MFVLSSRESQLFTIRFVIEELFWRFWIAYVGHNLFWFLLLGFVTKYIASFFSYHQDSLTVLKDEFQYMTDFSAINSH